MCLCLQTSKVWMLRLVRHTVNWNKMWTNCVTSSTRKNSLVSVLIHSAVRRWQPCRTCCESLLILFILTSGSWCGDLRAPHIPLLCNDTAQVAHTRASVTKQHKLVPCKEWWCPAARMVTLGVAATNGSLPPGLWQVSCGMTI